ncbi:hypothetical protein TNCV_4607271 [Trichonephila clavipes]|nr:hypothetical protein TNCV_4607271 [Trichonephila clavipes]
MDFQLGGWMMDQSVLKEGWNETADFLRAGPWVAWWLEHRTPDRKAWVRCHQTPSEHTRSTCSLNQWVHSLVGLITSAETGEYFPPLQFTCRNCGGGDRGRVAIYRPFGEFRRAKSYCHLITAVSYESNDSRSNYAAINLAQLTESLKQDRKEKEIIVNVER